MMNILNNRHIIASIAKKSRINKNWIVTSVYTLLAMTVAVLLSPTTALAACANPVGAAGDMVYNDSEHVMQWCEDPNWVGVGKTPYIPNAVNFDGTNDYLTIAGAPPTGVTDTKTVTISLWTKLPSSASAQNILDVDHFNMRVGSGGLIRFEGENSSASSIILNQGPAINDDNWHHILVSFDLSDVNKRHFYVDDILDNTYATYIDDLLDLSAASQTTIGATSSNTNLHSGEIADLWADFGTYIDFSVAANRRQFIDANGWPVDLGTDGSKATGAIPDIYLSGATAAWHTNKGTGGGFTENGALTTVGSQPGANLGPTGGLIGWWKLDETSGATAFDSSGNGNDATITHSANALFLPGVIGGSIDSSELNPTTNGVSFEVTGIFPLGVNPPFSVAMWVNRERGAESLFQNGPVAVSGEVRVHRSNYRVSMSPANFSPGITPIYNKWHHVAVTYDGTTFRIYINGALEDSGARTLTTTDDGFTFGGIGGSNGNSGARLDDVRLYDRELTGTEITELYETGFPCKNPVAQRDGDMMYNTTSHVPQYCNLREWKAMAPSAGGGAPGGCSNPAGDEGDVMYNSTSNVMQYCAGNTWRAIGKY